MTERGVTGEGRRGMGDGVFSDRAGWTFVAGFGAALLVLGVGFLTVYAAFIASAGSGGWIPMEPTATGRAIVAASYGVVPALLIVAGALPARALGLGWIGAFMVSLFALVTALLPTQALDLNILTVLVVFVTMPAWLTLAASLLTNGVWANLGVAVGASSYCALALAVHTAYSELASFGVALLGWTVLPTVAGAFRPRTTGADPR